MLMRTLFLTCAMALLAGCAGLTSKESVEGTGNPTDWKAHKERINAIDGW